MNAESCPADSEAKLRYLQAAIFPAQGGEPVRCLETHMSWLLLGRDQVLKLKKPVCYPFLDFSTVEARERDAREEIRVNRRLAPGIYLGLLALQWNEGAFSLVPEERLPAPGQTVDWLVAMRRLPADRMLDDLIGRHMLKPSDVDALFGVLVLFYRQARRCPIAEDDYVDRLRAEIAADRDVLTLPRLDLQHVDALLERMERALVLHDGLLRQRARERRIVEGHGDLRPEHVCLVDPPVVIDALEFDVRMREIDPFDELSFLGLECAMAGDAGIGPRLLARCADALDDHPGSPLLQLYTARRALLRARLSAAHLLEAQVRAPEQWLLQTRRYLVRASDSLGGFGPGDGH